MHTQHTHHHHRFALILATAVALFHHAGNAWAQPVLTPAGVSACPGTTGGATFTVTPSGTGNFPYQWQIQTSPGVWNTLGNDPMPLPCQGGQFAFAYASNPFSNQSPIGVHGCAGVTSYLIRCLVNTAQGPVPSNTATIRFCCPGDINCDNAVNIDDLLAVIHSWGPCPQPCSSSCAADVNFDCVVNIDDLLAVIQNWH